MYKPNFSLLTLALLGSLVFLSSIRTADASCSVSGCDGSCGSKEPGAGLSVEKVFTGSSQVAVKVRLSDGSTVTARGPNMEAALAEATRMIASPMPGPTAIDSVISRIKAALRSAIEKAAAKAPANTASPVKYLGPAKTAPIGVRG